MDITKYFSKAGGGTQSSSTKKEEKTKAADKPATRTTSKADKKDENAGATLATGRKKRAVIHSDDDDDVVMIDTKKAHDEGRKRTKKEAAKKEEEVDPNSYFASAKKGVKAVPTKKEDDKAIIVEEEKDDKSRKTKSKETPVNVKKDKPAASKSASKKRARVVDDDDDGDEDDYEFEPIEDDFDDELEIVEKKEPKESPKKPAAKGKVKEEKPKQEKAKENKKTESEDGEKKKSSLWQLKNRLPPQQLGTREIPTAEPNCFGGSTFVVSGEFESLTRSQTEDLIKRYGGRLTTGVSGKTTYFLKGRDAGPSKTEKAESLGTKILDEDGFFELLKKSKSKEVEMPAMPAPVPSTSKGKQKDNTDSSSGQADQLWTEKYKPTKIEEILGNKELVKRISNWLKDWDSNRSKFKFRNKEDINDFGAVLMSGPPGIGKTTAAHVVAKTNDYELLEFNASDVRNKKILEESVSEMMDNRTMTEFFVAGKPKSGDRLIKGKKVVLVMDEVDGMSAGDRGGAAEMAKLIKNSKIPVICICNDIRSKKIEPLLRVCYEAKFKRTPAAQLRARLMTIAFRENLKMEANAVDQLVEATRNDVRQIINIMSTYRLGQQSMNFDQAKAVGKVNEKYSQINLFDIPGILLSGSKNREMTLAQKSEIYFHDYSLSPLMFFENYFRWMPESAKAAPNQNEMELRHIDAIANAADAMSEGAMVDGMIHGSTQHWSLMPVHSMFSLVRPAHFMNGIFAGPHRINFPAWLGQNSKAGKRKRLLREIQIHMRTKSSGDKYEVRQSYLPVLNQRIYSALLEEDYDTAIEIMDSYFLDKDLVDAIAELEYPLKGQKTLASQLNTKQKTTFTKTYNAGSHPVMLQPGGQTIKKAIPVAMDDPEGTIFEEEGDFGGDVSEEEATPADDDTNLAKDKYIKTKELSAGGKGGKTAAKAGTKRKTAPASSSSKAKKKK